MSNIPGIASSEVLTAPRVKNPLLRATPSPVFDDCIVPANTTIAAYTPVTIAADKTVAVAVSGTPADGILWPAVVTNLGETKGAAVLRHGTVDIYALNFDASYDSDDKKLAAFIGASAPTVIFAERGSEPVAAPAFGD